MSTTRGLIGEFITCAAIMSLEQGWRVIHCPQDQIDIIAFLDNDLCASVKASSLRAKQQPQARLSLSKRQRIGEKEAA